MSNELAALFAKRFIQRRDVKAVQFSNGGYTPDYQIKMPNSDEPDLRIHGPLGFKMPHLLAHLEGRQTYGHYLLDRDSQARMFCLDIDLEKEGFYVPMPNWDPTVDEEAWNTALDPIACSPRDIWRDRTATHARNWLKYQMGILARRITAVIQSELGIGTAAAYSGNKGIHVYGFTGPMPASQIRQAALYVLDYMDEWDLKRGNHIFQHRSPSPELGYQNFTVEVYPKQDSIEEKTLGNLIRLPLGRNLKSADPTFFLDLTSPVGVMKPHPNPVQLLETGDPYS